MINNIYAKTRAATIKPELHDVVHSVPDFLRLLVEIRLLFQKEGGVVLVCLLVLLPG